MRTLGFFTTLVFLLRYCLGGELRTTRGPTEVTQPMTTVTQHDQSSSTPHLTTATDFAKRSGPLQFSQSPAQNQHSITLDAGILPLLQALVASGIQNSASSNSFQSILQPTLADSNNVQVTKSAPFSEPQTQPGATESRQAYLANPAANQIPNQLAIGQQQPQPGLIKQDRQGYHHEEYSPVEYSHHPHGYDGHYKKPPVAVHIDPLKILKVLYHFIPKPLLNLHGKVFLGVELGKNLDIKKGIHHHHHHPHHAAPKLVIGAGY